MSGTGDSAPGVDQLFDTVYEELKRLAASKLRAESPAHSLSATALVHEAYMRLHQARAFQNRSDFFLAAAVAMQRVLIDHARRKTADKRQVIGQKLSLDDVVATTDLRSQMWIEINEGLENLSREDEFCAKVASTKLFTGLSVTETAELFGISRAEAYREWSYAKAWLTDFLKN
jgi:RNA polymerase sigma factor (TIGR02999 family)